LQIETKRTFEIHLDDLLKQQAPVVLDMIEVENARSFATPEQFLQHLLSLEERQRSQIHSVQE